MRNAKGQYTSRSQYEILVFGIIFSLMFAWFLSSPEASLKVAVSKSDALARAERYEWFTKEALEMRVRNEKRNDTKVVRVLRGELAGQEELFLSSFSNREIGKYVMSVIVAESGGGLHSCGTYNYSGIMKNGRCENFSSVEDYIQNGIKKKTGKYFNDLDKVGVSEENLDIIFIGKGKYCTSGCEHWTTNFLATYNKLI
jgi:hypothetical protein